MSDFISRFSSIPEARIERCRKHALLDILSLSISTILCGANDWEVIEDFGREKLDW
jgi:hypothetical protein